MKTWDTYLHCIGSNRGRNLMKTWDTYLHCIGSNETPKHECRCFLPFFYSDGSILNDNAVRSVDDEGPAGEVLESNL